MGQEQKSPFHSASVIVGFTDKTEGRDSTLRFISTVQALSDFLKLDEPTKDGIKKISSLYPFRIPSFYADLIDKESTCCPIRLQSVPAIEELHEGGFTDPLGEEGIRITPTFFKRYPKRGLFLVSAECAMYCRFCNRRRLVGKGFRPEDSREETLTHIERSQDLREIIISGGDPLMLPPEELDYILARLRSMHHITTLRISTRIPVVCPELLDRHVKAIRAHAPLWFVIHINHPREVTPEFIQAVRRIREAGAQIISQTVLLKGINDCHHILGLLFEELLAAGIKPYYLFQLDDIAGAGRFKVRIDKGLDIMRDLRRSFSGLSIPQYALDITDGLGKVPLESGYIKGRKDDRVFIENLYGEVGSYADDGNESHCLDCGICRRSP